MATASKLLTGTCQQSEQLFPTLQAVTHTLDTPARGRVLYILYVHHTCAIF